MPKTLKLSNPEPTEAEVQAALMRRLRAEGFLVVRMNGGGFIRKKQFVRAYIIQGLNACAGFPDVLALRGHPAGFIEAHLFEVKRRGGELTPTQERFINFAAHFGIGVIIVEGWRNMERVTERLSKRP